MARSNLSELIPRRAALSAIGAGIAGFIPWPNAVLAHESTIPDYSFIVVSDTHLGRDDKNDAADMWQKTAQEFDSAAGDFVLHLGDVVDGGREKQYGIYKDIRRTIRIPVHEIPGNHDQASHFTRHFREKIDTSFEHQGVRFVLMNNSRFKDPSGFVTADQLKWLQQQCDDAASKNLFIILAMHVPIHDNRGPDPGFYVKPADGQAALYKLLAQHRDRFLATMHGHFHCGLRGWDDHGPLHEIIFPSALFNVNYKIAEQKAPGYNLPEFRPGYTLVRLNAAGMTLTYQPVGVKEGKTKVCVLTQLKS
jgi:3',5'-cyclic AMP phosphodiesterase CpdA